MAGKTRHLISRQGNFWARVVVPKSLRPIIGKTELREPLGSNHAIALKNLHAALVGFNAALDAARRQLPDTPTSTKGRGASIRELARRHYEAELRVDDIGRFTATPKPVRDLNREARAFNEPILRKLVAGVVTDEERAEGFIESTIGWAIDRLVEEGKVTVQRGTPEWFGLAQTLAAIQIEANRRANERDLGNFDGVPTHPLPTETKAPESDAEPVSLNGLLESYLQELATSGKGSEAGKRWRPCFKDLTKFIAHDDALKLTKADVVRWKDHLLKSKSPATIRNSNLASLRAVLQWATDNEKITTNPAAGVKVRSAPKKLNRSKGFTADEAAAILSAALAYQPKHSDNPQTREGAPLTAAKKWVPWLCAMTGARVAELTQLRKEDIAEQEGIHFIHITPDAGSVKSGKYRDVPLHPQLIELGFLEFIRTAPGGPLFYVEKTARTGAAHPSKTVAGRISQWLRSLELIPPDVDPSHGWRHRFKTIGREAGIDPRVLDAIQGHAARTAGDNYGDVSLKASNTAINKFPNMLVTAILK